MSPDPEVSDGYDAIEDGPEVELRDRGSRFFGQAFRAPDSESARAALHRVSRTYHDASHHCWGLRLGPPERAMESCDDDGEPSNTAGAPILGALRAAEVHDALVVVTRWFGGTKLGSGGLIRAYGAAAREALAAAPARRVWCDQVLELACSYEDLGAVEAVLARSADVIRSVERRFEERPAMTLAVLRSRTGLVENELTEATAGRVELRRVPSRA